MQERLDVLREFKLGVVVGQGLWDLWDKDKESWVTLTD